MGTSRVGKGVEERVMLIGAGKASRSGSLSVARATLQASSDIGMLAVCGCLLMGEGEGEFVDKAEVKVGASHSKIVTEIHPHNCH